MKVFGALYLLRRFGSTLVIVQHSHASIEPITRNAVEAARKLGDVYCLVGGYGCKAAAKETAKIPGVTKVFIADHQNYKYTLAERLSPLALHVHSKLKTTHILAGCSTFGRSVLPRVAAKLNVSSISDVIAIHDEETFQVPIYAGNALKTLKSLDPVRCLTIRSTAFHPDPNPRVDPAPIEEVLDVTLDALGAGAAERVEHVSTEKHKSDRPELTTADVVIAGGRGMKSAENFKLLYDLADKINAAVGASRAAVDGGFVPNDMQIGQTGKVVAPKLYIAVGISGAVQHLAGMKDSKVIVAINKDPDAPIFQVADYGLVEDLFKAIPEMLGKV
ncbi:unnamed protein product [Calicophoron daubneyi]|uniref:Electron transfer flavoprotein subunit alpha n=1 Tax=Calicophoron daubneyi TaxID=300641 RepID=A0AAV2T5Y5_CALDB